MAKVGRNDPCPCLSGKKYKKCHGDLAYMQRVAAATMVAPAITARLEAKMHQRSAQQGLGRPIIAATTDNGSQFVAVKNRLLHSKKWKTFHDFLGDYIKHALGPDWGNAELKKPLDQRHPILIWYHKVCDHQRLFIKEPGKVASGPMTGAVAAYMQLAYDLYSLDHNAELQTKLIARLRDDKNFSGARYEVQIAAMLVRAGFTLEFENEDDRSTSHCEFTATSTSTGKQFSVEAKRSESGRITRQLVRALNKAATHTRIIFIDLNTPDPGTGEMPPAYVGRAFDLLRRFEAVDPQAKRLPPAYVFLTNYPWEHHLDGTEWQRFALVDGFHIDEFKLDRKFSSLRAAINARQAHIEMHDLFQSMEKHRDIPATFDGESPEFAFGRPDQRLIIGNKYICPQADGTEIVGVLVSAVVLESEKSAYCSITTEDGRNLILTASLSDAELLAWKRHPDTFFGEVSKNRKTETALDLYDFLMETYTESSKEKLLEFLNDSPDLAILAELSQGELASVYCERLATNALAQGWSCHKPLLQTKWRVKDQT